MEEVKRPKDIKDKGNILGVRTQIKQGESISSYLIRLGTANGLYFREILSILLKERKALYAIMNHNEYRLDTVTSNYINIEYLSVITGQPKELFELSALDNLYMKLKNNNMKYKNELLNKQSTFFLCNERRFCPLCLGENPKIFYLKWQCLWVNICLKHNCNLTTKCIFCNKTQPYLHSNLSVGECCHCERRLSGSVGLHELKQSIKEVKKVDEDLKNLIKNNSNLYPHIGNFNQEKGLIISLLYANQIFWLKYSSDIYIYKEGVFLKDELRTFRDYMTNENNVKVKSGIMSLPWLFRILRRIDIDFSMFCSLEIPEIFIDTVVKYYHLEIIKKDMPTCIAKECRSFGKKAMICYQSKIEDISKDTFFEYKCRGCNKYYSYFYSKKEWGNYSKSS